MLRAPEFGAGAARVFRSAALVAVRRGDALVHETGSDRFLVALLDAGRRGAAPSPADCRTALERLVALVAPTLASRESGWWTIRRIRSRRDLDRAIALALERGKRERERREFLAALGHELRTPLTSIRGYLESVLDGDVTAVQSRSFLETARQQTTRLGALIDGMLEFSLLDLSPPPLDAPCCDVQEVAQHAVATLLPLARSRRVDLACDSHERVLAVIDRDECVHALLNLVDNAIRYGRAGGAVRISWRALARTVEVAVDDDGDGPHDRVLGHGIGLGIARKICGRAGGEVVLVRRQDGTRALLALPLARAAEGAERGCEPS
ncbi:MAG: sensor histidine kinase [Candidatus Tyrphobacter sp.]